MTRWNNHSNVADVLGLGPRTAGRLMQVGVRTAGELLQAKPKVLAGRLRDGLLTSETISAWQRETQLLLETPELEPEAARMLAALGFSRAEAIARTTPIELLAAWEASLAMQPEESWLRNSPRPGVGEVNNWIQQARTASSRCAA